MWTRGGGFAVFLCGTASAQTSPSWHQLAVAQHMRHTVNVGVSGLVVAQHLWKGPPRSLCQPHQGHYAGSRPTATKSLGPGGRADAGCAGPLPLVPSACQPDQQVMRQPPARCEAPDIAPGPTHAEEVITAKPRNGTATWDEGTYRHESSPVVALPCGHKLVSIRGDAP